MGHPRPHKQPRCVVLGGCGFLGSHLAEALLAAGHAVRIFDKTKVDTRNIVHLGNRVELMEGDFANEADLGRAIKGAECLFHLVGTTLPQTSTDNPLYDMESNVLSTLKLLDLAAKEKVKKVIYPSSGGTVYGIARTLPITEDHPTNPLCSYGIAKLTVEKYLEMYRLTRGLEYTCFRISNLYGERQSPHSIQGAIAVFLGLLRQGAPITIWGNGETVRDYLYVGDVVSVLVKALEVESPWRVFNLGSGKGTSLRQLLGILEEATGQEVVVRYAEARRIDVPVNVLDSSRARTAFGFEPVIALPAGVARTWQWMRKGEGQNKALRCESK